MRGRTVRSRAASRRKETILQRPPDPAARHEEAGRHHQRGRPAAESARCSDRAPKTVNNVLTVLERAAQEGGGVGRHRADAVHDPVAADPERRRRGSTTSTSTSGWSRRRTPRSATAYLIVLLGGEAGLRCGEMMALEWSDVDLGKRQLCVQRSDWKGHVTATKGGRLRYVPLTVRLATALREHRHLRGARVLCQRDGSPLTQKIVQDHVRRAARRAQLAKSGVHRLRHTFCSHLAMRGAPARAIQELAGHQDLTTTQRYMHLSPGGDRGRDSAAGSAGPKRRESFGDIVETGSTEIAKSSR